MAYLLCGIYERYELIHLISFRLLLFGSKGSKGSSTTM